MKKQPNAHASKRRVAARAYPENKWYEEKQEEKRRDPNNHSYDELGALSSGTYLPNLYKGVLPLWDASRRVWHRDGMPEQEFRTKHDAHARKLREYNDRMDEAIKKLTSILVENDMKPHDLFAELDINGDDAINAEELKEGLHRYGIMLDDFEVNEIIAAFDTDGSGDVDEKEWQQQLS